MKSIRGIPYAMLAIFIFISAQPLTAGSNYALGIKGGWSSKPDQFFIGGQGEFGKFLQSARFAPSVDIGFGDNSTLTAINLDLRWYLFPLPETGIYFYGAAGPTLAIISPDKGDSDSEIGLSLTAGAKIPMKGDNRYNLEFRFGIGDIPDLKIAFAILFGL